MSKSFKDRSVLKMSSVNTGMKRLANKVVRHYEGELPRGSAYKKMFDSTKIHVSVYEQSCDKLEDELKFKYPNKHITDRW